MKSLSQLSLRALLIAGSVAVAATATTAFAQEATEFDLNAQPSTVTRSEVGAEVAKARADGTLYSGEATEFALHAQPSTQSRAEIIAETVEAQRLGLLGHGEVNPPILTPDRQRPVTADGRVIAQERVSQR